MAYLQTSNLPPAPQLTEEEEKECCPPVVGETLCEKGNRHKILGHNFEF